LKKFRTPDTGCRIAAAKSLLLPASSAPLRGANPLTSANSTVDDAISAHHVSRPGAGATSAFKKDLASYQTAKGSIQFPFDKPLPFALIRRIVKFRVRQNFAKEK
jgi:hypothetical protein